MSDISALVNRKQSYFKIKNVQFKRNIYELFPEFKTIIKKIKRNTQNIERVCTIF